METHQEPFPLLPIPMAVPLPAGKEYIYTVRACKGSDRSYFDSKGVKELKLSIPSLSSAENVADGIKVTWKIRQRRGRIPPLPQNFRF